jgi:hypothetical protein
MIERLHEKRSRASESTLFAAWALESPSYRRRRFVTPIYRGSPADHGDAMARGCRKAAGLRVELRVSEFMT